VLDPLPSLELPPAPIADSGAPLPSSPPSPSVSGALDGLELATLPAGVALTASGYPAGTEVSAGAPAPGFSVQRSDPAVGPLRTAYGIVVLCAFLGAALLVVRMKTRFV
jgi:hypothetical protein